MKTIDINQMNKSEMDLQEEYCIIANGLTEQNVNKINELIHKGYRVVLLKITIHSAKDLPTSIIDSLNSNLDVTVQMDAKNLSKWQRTAYSRAEYASCREEIDRLLYGIDLVKDENDPLCETKRFMRILGRLAVVPVFDDELYFEIKKNDNNVDRKRFIRSSTMTGAFLDKIAMCAGLSEASRNLFECGNLECVMMSGISRKGCPYYIGNENVGVSHHWILIKLDGQWSHFDLHDALQSLEELCFEFNVLTNDDDSSNLCSYPNNVDRDIKATRSLTWIQLLEMTYGDNCQSRNIPDATGFSGVGNSKPELWTRIQRRMNEIRKITGGVRDGEFSRIEDIFRNCISRESKERERN